MPIGQTGTLGPRLNWLDGVTAYGASAQGGTRDAYDRLCATVIGGPLNMRRAFNGLPEPGDGPTVWSTKEFSPASIADRHLAFAKYGKPAVDVYHHEPNPDLAPDVWRTNAAAVLTRHSLNVARAACFMAQDARDGSVKRFLPTKPDWLDLLLFDGYCLDAAGGKSPQQLFGACSDEAERLGVPWGIAEHGVAGKASDRLAWENRAIEWVCDDKHCVLWCWFNSSVGNRTPVVFDGSKSWQLDKSADRYTPEMSKLWRELAALTRWQAADAGSPAEF